MSDVSQAQPPAGHEPSEQVDDSGLSAEEQAQFAEMEKATPDPDAGSEPPPEVAPSAEETAVAAGAAAAAVTGEDDDEDDDTSAAGTQPAAGEKPPKRRVSARKYERAEAARLAAEEKAHSLELNQTKLAERLNILTAALQPAAEKAKTPEEEDPEPDAEKDIFAHNAWLTRKLTTLSDRLQKSELGAQAQSEEQTIATTYVDDARSFAAQEPNFPAAYNFLMENRTVELAQYYFGLDLTDPKCPQLTNEQVAQIKSSISAEERTLVTNAIKGNRSPAASVFAMARARGFRPPAAALAPAAAAAAAAAPKVPPVAPGSLAEPPAAGGVGEEIERIKAGSEAARSLSSGGGAPPSPLTPEKLAAMDDADFGALLETMTKAQEAALFGS